MNANRSNKKQFILETAAGLFRDKGYTGTSMRQLAEAVDLKASSIYSHFRSKEEILQTICFENAQLFMQNMQIIEQKDNSPIQKLEALLDLHIRIATEERTSVTAFNEEWRHLSAPKLQEFLSLRKDYENRFCAIIELGKKQQQFQNIATLTIFYTILSSIRWLYDWKKPSPSKIKQFSKELKELLLKGIIK